MQLLECQIRKNTTNHVKDPDEAIKEINCSGIYEETFILAIKYNAHKCTTLAESERALLKYVINNINTMEINHNGRRQEPTK